MSIKINNQDIVAINKGNQVITDVYKGTDLVWAIDDDIFFEDPEVGRVLHANGLIADPIKSSKRELRRITSLRPDNIYISSYFEDNKVITKFPELQYCTGLTSVSSLFYGCSNLIEAPIIPEGVTSMAGTFRGCSSLTEAPIIPESVTNMSSTFRNCTSLVDAPTIPSNVTNMKETFAGCSSLVNAPTIPESVTDMTQTFDGCTSLDGIFIIKPIHSPNYDRTLRNVNVKAIYVPDESVYIYKRTGWRDFEDKIYPISSIGMDDDIFFADPEVGRELHANGLIADPIKSSERELSRITAFYRYPNYGNIFYENKVITKFPELKYCTGLTTMDSTFYGCTNLTEVGNIPEGVTNMYGAFRDCINLIEAPIIPNSVTTMTGTFSGCTGLTEAPIIPDSVTNMEGTFSGCTGLTEAPIIPNSVTNMDSTFRDCTNLIEAPIIPNSVTNMTLTFRGCTSLLNAPIIPEGVTKMGWAFRGCTNLDGIFIIKPINPPTYNITFEDVNVVAIYVPDESVNSYKTASGWSEFADKIYPMSQLP